MAANCPLGLRRVTSDKDSSGKPALPSCSQRADAAGPPQVRWFSIEEDFGAIWGIAGPGVRLWRRSNGFLRGRCFLRRSIRRPMAGKAAVANASDYRTYIS